MVSNGVQTLRIMNHPKIVFLFVCLVALMLSAPVLNAAPRGGGGGGHHFAAGGGRPGMAARPGMGAWRGQRWAGGNWRGGNGGSNWQGRHWGHGGNWHGGNWHNGHHHGHNN